MGEAMVMDKGRTRLIEGVFGVDRFGWINSVSTGKIVDIGGNDGHTFGRGTEDVTVVDIDLYDIPNFVRASADDLPFKDKEFDTAVLAEILEHVPDPVKAMKEAKRVAKQVIMTVPDEYKWEADALPFHTGEMHEKNEGKSLAELAKEGNPDAIEFYDDGFKHLWHERFYTREMLLEDIKEAGFEEITISEGTDGRFCWFLVVAK